ncbi:hypothetical protein C8J56DRAFT_1060521 [Mycena floridula]|nr:hypothetical protein C8J56DRAFT_1060521 [Mycena floridula]
MAKKADKTPAQNATTIPRNVTDDKQRAILSEVGKRGEMDLMGLSPPTGIRKVFEPSAEQIEAALILAEEAARNLTREEHEQRYGSRDNSAMRDQASSSTKDCRANQPNNRKAPRKLHLVENLSPGPTTPHNDSSFCLHGASFGKECDLDVSAKRGEGTSERKLSLESAVV